jgi:hypothetical protein
MALKLQFGNFGAGLRVARDVDVSLQRNGGTWDLKILPHAPAASLGPPAQRPDFALAAF